MERSTELETIFNAIYSYMFWLFMYILNSMIMSDQAYF